MSETEATGVPDDSAPATSLSADATEHTPIGVIESVEEAVGGAEKWVDDHSSPRRFKLPSNSSSFMFSLTFW